MPESTHCPPRRATPSRGARFMALTGGSTALAAFLAACGERQRHDHDDRRAWRRRRRQRNRAVRQGRRRHPQLRPDARVPGDRLLRGRRQERPLQGLRPGDDQEVRQRGGRTRRRADRRGQAARRQAGAEAEDRIPAEERQVGARTGGRRSRTSAPPPTSARRRTSRAPKCSPRRSRSTASRAATRRRSTRCSASRSPPTAPSPSRPTRRPSSSRSNPSSSAEPASNAKGERR